MSRKLILAAAGVWLCSSVPLWSDVAADAAVWQQGSKQQGGKQAGAKQQRGGSGGQQGARGQGGGQQRVAQQQGRGQQGGRGQQKAAQQQGGGQQGAARGQGGGRQNAAQQGRGGGGRGEQQKQQVGRGQDRNDVARGRSGSAQPGAAGRGGGGSAVGRGQGRSARGDLVRYVNELPPGIRTLARSDRVGDRMFVSLAARGVSRGMDPDALMFERNGERIRFLNHGGALLFDMDEQRALELGAWDMRMLGDERPRGNAPAFCRSGAGHPVFGREWCRDKGFGLGSDDGWLWSRRDVDDITFQRRIERDRYDRGGLIDILGDIVFGRLALHALTLGFTEPLVGVWVAQPQSPRILYVESGPRQVAELVDLDGDNRVDVMYVTQSTW